MNKSTYLVLVLILIVLGFDGAVHAGFSVTRVTTNAYEDNFPHIKGDYVVWQGKTDVEWDIFVCRISTGTITQIENEGDDVSVRTDGTFVVWQGSKYGEWDIFLWNGGEPQVISEPGAQDYLPQIADGLIAWTSEPMGAGGSMEPGEVFLYDADPPALSVLSAAVDPGNTLDDSRPRIGQEAVVWVQTDNQGQATLYAYDLATGEVTGDPDNVAGYGSEENVHLRAMTRRDGHDAEVFIYNPDTSRYHQITENGFDDRYPASSENWVVWTAGGEIFLAECKLLALISPVDGAVLSKKSPSPFKWESIGYDKSKLQFSRDPGFSSDKRLALPAQDDTWLLGTSYTPSESEWKAVSKLRSHGNRVYWRVKGQDSGGKNVLTETWHFILKN